MKNVLYVLIFVLLASSVCAASFTMNDLEFGSTTQARGLDVTQTLHVANDGTDALTINLTSSMLSSYNVRFSQSVLTLTAGSSADVTVTIFVPLTQASGRNEVTGGIVATANVSGLSKTAKTYITTLSMLEIYKVTMNVDDNEKSLHRGDTFSSEIIKAGATVTFTAYVRNNYNSAQDIDINDVNIDMRSSGDLDLDESDTLNDLQYGERDQISFSATIPSDAEDGDSYDVDVSVTGRDQNGILHSDKFNTAIEVKRVSHEITIKSFTLSPQSIVCKGKVTVNVELKNTGRYSEDKVHLEISNNDLGLEQRFTGMTLNEDSTIKKTYSFNIDNNTEPGQYDILLTSFYNSDTESDVQVLTLTVNPCQTTTTTTTTPTTVVNPGNTIPPMPQVVPTNGATPVYGSASFTDSPTYLVILIAAVIVILLILIILLVKFVF